MTNSQTRCKIDLSCTADRHIQIISSYFGLNLLLANAGVKIGIKRCGGQLLDINYLSVVLVILWFGG